MSEIDIDLNNNKKLFLHGSIVFAFLLFCRLLAMYIVPLMDSTEARYGEIAREMLRSNNWITLYIDYGIPFWAKPPLSSWLSASSMYFFGINELAARMPSLLLSIAILWMLASLVKKQSGRVVALITTLSLAGSLYFYLDAGTVMTDPALLFCITLTMIAFWRAITEQSKSWSYLFFIALGLGLLAKGPVAIILAGMPIFAWVLLRKKWKLLRLRLPWLKGSLITAFIALPWYILAEIKTPGFFKYFIVGEHFNRFAIPGWNGNLYGFSHVKPYGIIWIYAFLGLLPWSPLVFYFLISQRKKIRFLESQKDNGWLSYILLWLLVPLFFFTFSSNIIYTYVFPSLPAFALLIGELWKRSGISEQSTLRCIYISAFSGFCFLFATVMIALNPGKLTKSQRPVIAAWLKQPYPRSILIYWYAHMDYSAQFYSNGRAIATKNPDFLRMLLAYNPYSYLVVKAREKAEIPADIYTGLAEADTVKITKEKLQLFRKIT